MGAYKDIIYPIYEQMLDEFEESVGRTATREESIMIWKKAEEKWQEDGIARADCMRKAEMEDGHGH